jgi:hypothetical protein
VKAPPEASQKKWWEKPVGIVALGVLIVVLGDLTLRSIHAPTPSTASQETKSQPQLQPPQQAPTSAPATAPTVQAVSAKKHKSPSHTAQRATTKIDGSDNVAGNNVAGNSNVVGNNNQSPVVNAPGGMPIIDNKGIIFNPTVNNNFGPPQRTISQTDRDALISALTQHRGTVTFGFLGTDPGSESYRFARQLYNIFDAARWTMNAPNGVKIAPLMAGQPWSGVLVHFEGDPKQFLTLGWSSVPPDAKLAAQALLNAHVTHVSVSPQRGVGKDWVLIVIGPNPDN